MALCFVHKLLQGVCSVVSYYESVNKTLFVIYAEIISNFVNRKFFQPKCVKDIMEFTVIVNIVSFVALHSSGFLTNMYWPLWVQIFICGQIITFYNISILFIKFDFKKKLHSN